MGSRKAWEFSPWTSVVRRSIGCPLVAAAFIGLISAAALGQQPEHGHGARADTARVPMRVGPLGIPQTREASGTSWLPDFSPMYAFHWRVGRWDLMLHGNAFLYYIDEGSDRGDEDFGSINWIMAMARRAALGGELGARVMLSAEPATIGECGYPDLLATGEFCDELGFLHDRQHPHDLFMELAAEYERAISDDLALQLYGGLAGEPALGPVGYPHRLSALPNPFAPITHHWQDATHIVFGVVTAGLFTRNWKLEGSLFNGREPDENRWDLDLDALDSYSGRLWYADQRWALQLSGARLTEAELHEIGGERESLNRYTASATYHHPLGRQGFWATTAVWGRNDEEEASTDSFLLESAIDLDGRNLFYGRGEVVEKTGGDLVLEVEELEDAVFTVGKVSVGYTRQFGPYAGLLPGLGAAAALSFIPDNLEPFYDTNVAFGWSVFASLRPEPMRMHEAPAPPPERHHGDHRPRGSGEYRPESATRSDLPRRSPGSWKRADRQRATDLPERLRGYFWDHAAEHLAWEGGRHTIVLRLLQSGGMDACGGSGNP